MATESAQHAQGLDSHGHSNINSNSAGSPPAPSSSTDQDALFDLILQKVPPQKREMLSTSWSKDYLNRLTSLPARALHTEPEKLREEQLKVERDMSELAFRDYKAFILVKDCKQEVQSTFETLGQHLDTFQETIPQFVESLSGFSARVTPILERQHIFSSILATHSQLLEVLEIPLLMETCVRNGYYNEALELASHVQRLVLRYPGIGIIQDIDVKVAQGKELMLVQLLAQLREPIKLPVALRIIGFLRRIGSFKDQLDVVEDEEQLYQGSSTSRTARSGHAGPTFTSSTASSSVSALAVEDETPLKMLFLKSRALYMNLQLSKIVHHKGDSFGYLKKYVDVTRECLFDIMTYYKSIFGSTDNYSGFSSIDYRGSTTTATTALPAGTGADISTSTSSRSLQDQKQHYWSTDNLLADFVSYRTQILLQTLQTHIPQIHDTSALSSVLTQLMYFGANMAKIGFDLRYLVTSLFEEAVIRVVGGAFQRGADEFLDSLGGEGKDHPQWTLPSQWMLGGTGRPLTSLTSPPSSTKTPPAVGSSSPGGSGSTSMSPQTCLMDYPALAYLTNSYLTALNSLRLLAPLSLAIPLREILVDSLSRVDRALEEYDRFIFGKRASAFRTSLSPAGASAEASQDSNANKAEFRTQGMEGSAVLNEQKIMDGFVVVYKRAVQDYILKCFDEGIYGGLVHVENAEDGGQDVDVDDDDKAEEQVVIDTAPSSVETSAEPTLAVPLESVAQVDAPDQEDKTDAVPAEETPSAPEGGDSGDDGGVSQEPLDEPSLPASAVSTTTAQEPNDPSL
ncbi:conserved oligomeric Golgi complex component [Mortierella antarctica]|nr:conserved oligomeric Golgi complex component [Mortierella antarctica]